MAFLWAGQIAFAQAPSTREGDLAVHWEHCNIESGLTSQFVRDALLDRDGFLWVATVKGLNRFDSQTFTAHGPTVSAQSISMAPSGDLWIGASGRRDWVRIDSILRLQPHTLQPLPSFVLPNITNTFKHCDPDAARIAVHIHLRHLHSGRYSAFYDDHGPGLPADANFSDDHSIGLWLIAEMVRKLGGSVHVSRRTRSRLIWTFEEPNPLFP